MSSPETEMSDLETETRPETSRSEIETRSETLLKISETRRDLGYVSRRLAFETEITSLVPTASTRFYRVKQRWVRLILG